MKESYRPGFLKAMRRPKEAAPIGDLITVAMDQLPGSGVCVVTSEGRGLIHIVICVVEILLKLLK